MSNNCKQADWNDLEKEHDPRQRLLGMHDACHGVILVTVSDKWEQYNVMWDVYNSMEIDTLLWNCGSMDKQEALHEQKPMFGSGISYECSISQTQTQRGG